MLNSLKNNPLTIEENKLLSCSKENWHKDKPHNDKFIEILKKYITSYSTDTMVFLQEISASFI
jgi:hypothetical protein